MFYLALYHLPIAEETTCQQVLCDGGGSSIPTCSCKISKEVFFDWGRFWHHRWNFLFSAPNSKILEPELRKCVALLEITVVFSFLYQCTKDFRCRYKGECHFILRSGFEAMFFCQLRMPRYFCAKCFNRAFFFSFCDLPTAVQYPHRTERHIKTEGK